MAGLKPSSGEERAALTGRPIFWHAFGSLPVANPPLGTLTSLTMLEPCVIDTLHGQVVSQVHPLESAPQVNRAWVGEAISNDKRPAMLFRHSGWARHRRLIADSLIRTGQSWNRQESFADCGSHAYVMRSIDDPTKHRIAGSCCHDRFCLPCAKGRAHTIAGNVLEYVRKVEIRFLTLTIKTDQQPLAWQIDKLYTAFQALRRTRLWKARIDGGVAFLEVKRSDRANRWHPHLHCLITGKFIDKRRLSTTWHAITGDSYIVDIRRPKDDEQVLSYVTKYASKPVNNTFINKPEWLDEAITALAGRKLALTFGRWRSLKLSPIPDPGAWEYVCPLTQLLNQAGLHVPSALRILESLGYEDLGDILPRPPPEPSPPEHPAMTGHQRALFNLW